MLLLGNINYSIGLLGARQVQLLEGLINVPHRSARRYAPVRGSAIALPGETLYF
jgi:hypothetical protein